jgi:hypothetical protein
MQHLRVLVVRRPVEQPSSTADFAMRRGPTSRSQQTRPAEIAGAAERDVIVFVGAGGFGSSGFSAQPDGDDDASGARHHGFRQKSGSVHAYLTRLPVRGECLTILQSDRLLCSATCSRTTRRSATTGRATATTGCR